MKIPKVGSSGQASSAKKKSAAKAGEFADQVRGTQATGPVDDTDALEGSTSMGAVESIVAVQEVPDATDGRGRKFVREYGDDLLDRLDALRLGILAGAIPKEELAELAHRLREKRLQSDDPRLNEIIDEIELRAEVEVAKLTRDRM